MSLPDRVFDEAFSELLTPDLGDAPAQAGCNDPLGFRVTNISLTVRRDASLCQVLVVTHAKSTIAETLEVRPIQTAIC